MKKISLLLVTGSLAFLTYFGTKMSLFATGAKELVQLEQKKVIQLQGSEQKVKINEGDIIFQTSTSPQSKAIQLATNSQYSHMGIIFKKNGQFFVYEAVQPVKFTPLAVWIHRGKNGHYVIKRLKNADRLLSRATLSKMKKIAEQYKGKPYDLYFEWSDDKIYCSELVWKIYKQATDIAIGQLEKLSDFNLTKDIVKAKMKERYGDHIPWNELVISPAAMFNSDQLMTIEEN